MWTLKRIVRFFVLWFFSVPRNVTGWIRYWRDFWNLTKVAPASKRPDLRWLQPQIGEDTAETELDATYFYQDAWAFEKIYTRKPSQHVDVGSHNQFVALLSKVVPVTMVDIRPLPVTLESLQFKAGSILALPYADNSIPSVSSICVIEHIGLGRYGDPIDPDGSEKALRELMRIVQPGGDLLISVPIDVENRIYFNAHRAFREDYLLELFRPFEVIEKRYIYGNTFGSEIRSKFGTGCYLLRKPLSQ